MMLPNENVNQIETFLSSFLNFLSIELTWMA